MFERRFWDAKELRTASDEDGEYLEGYAVPYNKLSEMLWGFREEIAPGAFTESIQNDDVKALWQHDSTQVLGRTGNNTLFIREDEHGVFFKVYPAPTQVGKDALISVKRGDVTSVSFGFNIINEGEEWREDDDLIIRRVTQGKLFEISPVTWAAYPQTIVQARNLPSDYVDENYGPLVNIPSSIRQATSDDNNNIEQHQMRNAQRKRKLYFIEKGL